MTFVSLFAGIGGIDLGLERAGHTCVGQVEIDPYCQKVLARHWPETPRISDVRDFHGHEFGPFDLLTGGYPCQPFSHAGKRAGEHDPRHLWPEVHRIICDVRPAYVLLENVPGHLSLGFGRVLGDLAESGYDAEWDCVPASAVGAPHQRDRVWIVAYPNGDGREPAHPRVWPGVHDDLRQRAATQRRRHQLEPRPSAHVSAMADTKVECERAGLRPSEPTGQRRGRPGHGRSARHTWAVEPDVGRVAHGVPDRTHRLRALGNAVVPQVAELIGRRLPA